MKLHESITPERVTDAVKESMFDLSNPGFCVDCGDDTDGVEPDARNYKCHVCGHMSVFGAEELLFHLS
jgi:hypothetical protein